MERVFVMTDATKRQLFVAIRQQNPLLGTGWTQHAVDELLYLARVLRRYLRIVNEGTPLSKSQRYRKGKAVALAAHYACNNGNFSEVRFPGCEGVAEEVQSLVLIAHDGTRFCL